MLKYSVDVKQSEWESVFRGLVRRTILRYTAVGTGGVSSAEGVALLETDVKLYARCAALLSEGKARIVGDQFVVDAPGAPGVADGTLN